jgi:hypothetical protein
VVSDKRSGVFAVEDGFLLVTGEKGDFAVAEFAKFFQRGPHAVEMVMSGAMKERTLERRAECGHCKLAEIKRQEELFDVAGGADDCPADTARLQDTLHGMRLLFGKKKFVDRVAEL